MVIERVEDLWSSCQLARCIQCGTVTDWLIAKHRQESLAKGVEMPKFLSEESKREWVKKVQAQRAKTMAKRKHENEPVVTVDDYDGEMIGQAFLKLPSDLPATSTANGHSEPDWMVKALGGLYDRRSCLQGEMEKVEAAIQAVKALA